MEDLRRHLLKLHQKLRDKVKGLHIEMASMFVKNYKLVSLGKIGVSSIVKKTSRNIGKKTTRELHAWQHYSFRKRLVDRARKTSCIVVIQEESYTSKTCGMCSVKKENLGGNETFQCESCHYVTGRDVNGARNILRKNITNILKEKNIVSKPS